MRGKKRKKMLIRVFLELDSDSDGSSDSDAPEDEDGGSEELLLMYLQCCKKLRLRFDRGWTARGGMYVTSLNQIPDDAHWQRRMFRFEKADIERLMGLINWPAAGHFSGARCSTPCRVTERRRGAGPGESE